MQFRHFRLEETGFAMAVGCAERGDLTMPQSFMDIAEQLEPFADQKRPTDESEKLVDKALMIFNRFSRQQLIAEHIQPALAEYMADFSADVALVRKYASEYTIQEGLLTESDEVRHAYIRFLHSGPRYDSIRRCWELFFKHSGGDALALLETAKTLMEVGNLPDLVGDWMACEKGRATWPWGPSYHWTRLAWLVTHGGRVQCPTLLEATDTWTRYRDAGKAA